MKPIPISPRLAALAAAVALLAACQQKAPPPPAPRLVVTHAVGGPEQRSEANYAGEIRPRHEAALGFRIGGKLVSRLVDVGQSVKAGQTLARLDPADAELNAGAARATLAAAESELAFATAEVARYRDLRQKNFVSQTALDAKEAAYRGAQGRAEAARAQADLARNQKDYSVLVADADGVISAVLADPGQVLAAGQPVLRLARPGEPEAAIAIPEGRLAELKAAKEIRVTLWAAQGKAGASYAGRIREIAPMADPVTRTYPARIGIVAPDNQVRLGMTVNVQLAGRREAAFLVPAAAIFQQEGKTAVWIVDGEQKLSLRPVQVAQFREDGALVADGLTAGERIVAAGVHKVVAGETVRVAP